MEQLATRCPQCQTQFRVTMAQLELREGKVRCGSCREIFNGIDHVFEYTGDEDFALSPPPAQQDSSDRMTLIDFGSLRGLPTAPAGPSMQEELDALSRAIADLQSKPWAEPPASPRSEFADDDPGDDEDRPQGSSPTPNPEASAEPVFVQETRRRQRGQRAWKALLWTGSALLLLALAAQLIFQFRHDIAARYPEAAPYLRAACAELGCLIRLPTNIDKLSLVSSRLEATGSRGQGTSQGTGNGTENTPDQGIGSESGGDASSALPGRFVLVALLRNQGEAAQAWPALDLHLKDAAGKVLVRRVFLPDQYAQADELRAGMPSRSEREIRIPFELSGDPPAGFELTIFYH